MLRVKPGSSRHAVDVIHARLEDGRTICIRRITETDEQGMREGIARMSRESRYLRFFSGADTPPDRVIEALVDIDGHENIAWAAFDIEAAGQPGIGAVHAMRGDADTPIAEYAIGVVDDYQGLGIARLLTATALLDARDEGIRQLGVYTLAENHRMIGFMKSLGATMSGMDGGTTEYVLGIEQAITRMREASKPTGLEDVFRAFDAARDIIPPSETPPAT